MPSDHAFLTALRLELAYFGGRARQRRDVGGAGVILRFQRVLPRRAGRFQPLQASEITPAFLDRTVRAIKRWNYDIVTLDEACRRAVILAQPRRFVCLTFDGGYKDVARAVYPILAHHRVPFAIYLPTGFPDGLTTAWWLALAEVIARTDRIHLIIDRRECRLALASAADKREAYAYLANWLRQLPPAELALAINDLCKRYSVDLSAVTREAMMDWNDLARLAADPLVTIGCATVNYPVLSTLTEVDAMREITMGKAVAEAAFQREVRHFAFPFGDRDAFRRAHVTMSAEAGFSSAVTAIPGIVDVEGRTNLHVLPRISWDGRLRSLRAMRVLLSGADFAPVQPTSRPDSEPDV